MPIKKDVPADQFPNPMPKPISIDPSKAATPKETMVVLIMCLSRIKNYVGIIPIPPPPPMPPPPLLPKLLIRVDPREELLPPDLLARVFFAPPENFLLLTPELL
jgi:hypothetical protein